MFLRIEVTTAIAERLTEQATTLLLHRNAYVRAVLAVVAAQPAAKDSAVETCPQCGAGRPAELQQTG